MTEQRETAILEAIRKADAHTNAATVLMDAEEERGVPEGYPEFWVDIRRFVIPQLEREAAKVQVAVERPRR